MQNHHNCIKKVSLELVLSAVLGLKSNDITIFVSSRTGEVGSVACYSPTYITEYLLDLFIY